MDKLGVVEDEDRVKTAQEGDKRCPECGSLLKSSDTTNVAVCPDCGTKPFERHAKDESR